MPHSSTAYLLLSATPQSQLSAELFAGVDAAVIPLTGDPRPQLQELPTQLASQGLTLGRIIAVVDATELEKRRELQPWFQMLAHFADVLLLTHTRQVSPAWLGALQKSLRDRPMQLFLWPECLNKNKDSTLEQILYPEARRLTQYFDTDLSASTPIFASDDEDPSEAIDDNAQDEEIPPEPYFARDAAGRYKIKFLTP